MKNTLAILLLALTATIAYAESEPAPSSIFVPSPVPGNTSALSKAFGKESAPGKEAAPPKAIVLFDQYVSASAAASQCSKPEQKTIDGFTKNFQQIAMDALQALEKRHPKRTQQELAESMKKQSFMLSQAVFAQIKQKGCDEAQIREMTKRFAVLANKTLVNKTPAKKKK